MVDSFDDDAATDICDFPRSSTTVATIVSTLGVGGSGGADGSCGTSGVKAALASFFIVADDILVLSAIVASDTPDEDVVWNLLNNFDVKNEFDFLPD